MYRAKNRQSRAFQALHFVFMACTGMNALVSTPPIPSRPHPELRAKASLHHQNIPTSKHDILRAQRARPAWPQLPATSLMPGFAAKGPNLRNFEHSVPVHVWPRASMIRFYALDAIVEVLFPNEKYLLPPRSLTGPRKIEKAACHASIWFYTSWPENPEVSTRSDLNKL